MAAYDIAVRGMKGKEEILCDLLLFNKKVTKQTTTYTRSNPLFLQAGLCSFSRDNCLPLLMNKKYQKTFAAASIEKVNYINEDVSKTKESEK